MDPVTLALAKRQIPPALTQGPARRILTRFQADHGWVHVGSGTPNLNDATAPALGGQSASVTTAIDGTFARIEGTGLNLNLTGQKRIRLLIRIDGKANFHSLNFYAGPAGLSKYVLKPIGTNAGPPHLVDGEWTWWEFGLEHAIATNDPNLAAIDTIRLAFRSDMGTNMTVSVNAVEVVDPHPGYPGGVVSFTWDDGWATQYTRARKVLDAYGYAGVAYLINDALGDGGGNFMTNEQALALQELSGWQLGAHATNFTTHDATFAGLTEPELVTEFEGILEGLAALGAKGGLDFAWPLNAYDALAVKVAQRYFRSARTTNGAGQYHNSFPPRPLHHMASVNLGSNLPLAQAQAAVDQCAEHGTWLIFTGHKVGDTSADSLTWSEANLDGLCAYLASKGVAVRTVAEVLDSVGVVR